MGFSMQTDRKGRILYIPHGGGPLPLLGDAAHRGLVEFLTSLRHSLDAPSAILVVSAHWEENSPHNNKRCESAPHL